MEAFLTERNKLDFGDIVSKHDVFTIYNNAVKDNEAWSEKAKKYITYDMQLLLLNRGLMHTTLESNDKRFKYHDGFETNQIKYYEEVVKQTEQPILRFYYYDYLIEYGDKKKAYSRACDLIDTVISLDPNCSNDENTLDLLDLLSRMIDVIVKYKIIDYRRVAIDLLIKQIKHLVRTEDYRWCLELSQLLYHVAFEKNEKHLSDEEIDYIINVLEKGKDHYVKGIHMNLIEGFIYTLINWHKALKADRSVMNNLMIEMAKGYELQAIDQDGREKKSKYVEAHFLEYAAQIYLDLGMVAEAKSIQVRIKQAYKEYKENEMHAVPIEFTIKREMYEKYYNIFKDDSLEKTFLRLTYYEYQIPIKRRIEEETKGRLANPSISMLALQTKIGEGRKLFEARSDEERYRNEFNTLYGDELLTHFAIMYDYVWTKLIEDGLTLEMLKERIFSWQYFGEESKLIIEIGLEHYWKGEYVAAMCILVPQFENSFRQFFHAGENPTTVVRKGHTQQEQTFNRFLENDFVKKNIGEDFLKMIEFVLVDEVGHNLRNNIAHGLSTMRDFGRDYAHTIVYMYFVLTTYHWKLSESEDIEQED